MFFSYKPKTYRKLTKQERIDSFLNKCFILCPRCLTIHPMHTKTCTTCMEVLDSKERIFQNHLHDSDKNKYNLLKVETSNENIIKSKRNQ